MLARVEPNYRMVVAVVTADGRSPSRLRAAQHSRTSGGSGNRNSLLPCGDIVADGCEVYDPDCQVCQSANSDAPEWTI